MPGAMPYHLEKGPWLVALENYFNVSVEERMAYLEAIQERRWDGLSGFVGEPMLGVTPEMKTPTRRQLHMNLHWFGRSRRGDPQPTFRSWLDGQLNPDTVSTDTDQEGDDVYVANLLRQPEVVEALRPRSDWPITGMWQQYYGNVEAIVVETALRALTVALGIDPEGQPTRNLPIEIFWKCPQRWFETWITWRSDPSPPHAGQVTLILATPGSGTPLLERYADGRGADPKPDLNSGAPLISSDPTEPAFSGPSSAAPRGMWTVTHTHNILLPTLSATGESKTGDWSTPDFGPSYAGTGPIICVSPSFEDGGLPPVGGPAAKIRQVSQSGLTAS